MDNKTTTKSGIGFTGLLTIAFIVLKLVGVIKWSWLWVLSPVWICIAISMLAVFTMFIYATLKVLGGKA